MRTGGEEGRWIREGGTPLSGGGADRGVGGEPGEVEKAKSAGSDDGVR